MKNVFVFVFEILFKLFVFVFVLKYMSIYLIPCLGVGIHIWVFKQQPLAPTGNIKLYVNVTLSKLTLISLVIFSVHILLLLCFVELLLQ